MVSSTKKDLTVKRTRDFYEGQIKREQEAFYLNDLFFKMRIPCQFSRFHHVLKAMNTNKKVENNILNNYVGTELGGTGMSLHYRLKKIGTDQEIPFIFAYEGSGGIYLKLPSEFKTLPQAYLDLLAFSNYHILVVSKDSTESVRLYSRAIAIQDIIDRPRIWKWKMGTSKGNTNRLQFYGALSLVKYRVPYEPSLLEVPLLEQLDNLFQK